MKVGLLLLSWWKYSKLCWTIRFAWLWKWYVCWLHCFHLYRLRDHHVHHHHEPLDGTGCGWHSVHCRKCRVEETFNAGMSRERTVSKYIKTFPLEKVELVLGLERIFSRLRRIFGGEHLQYEEITKQRRHKLLWFLKQDVLSVKNILAQLKREESDSGPLHLHLQ